MPLSFIENVVISYLERHPEIIENLINGVQVTDGGAFNRALAVVR